MKDLYCKIFIDTKKAYPEVFQKIQQNLSGRKQGFRDMESAWCELTLSRNQEYLPGSDNFLFWKYYLDIEPVTEEAEYIRNMKAFVKFLKENFSGVVPACDFEEELTEKTA